MREVRKIKGLQSQLKSLDGDIQALKIELSNKQSELTHKMKAFKAIKSEISKLENNNDIRVSEHAIVRYFERVKGFDISEIEKEIITEEVTKLIDVLGGSGKYPNKDFQVVMKDFTVTSIIK